MTDPMTELARKASGGEAAAIDAIFKVIYDELHRSAELLLRHERPDHTLQPTALVHEAYLKMIPKGETEPGGALHGASRTHLIAIGARAMRQVLIDHARSKKREKRGGGENRWRRILLDDAFVGEGRSDADIDAVHEAIERLRERDAVAADLVDLRIFGGLKAAESAVVLGLSVRTAEREWAFARAWLRRELSVEDSA